MPFLIIVQEKTKDIEKAKKNIFCVCIFFRLFSDRRVLGFLTLLKFFILAEQRG